MNRPNFSFSVTWISKNIKKPEREIPKSFETENQKLYKNIFAKQIWKKRNYAKIHN